MKTFTQLKAQYLSMTKDSTMENQDNAGVFINSSIRTICNLQGGKLRFLEATKDMYTVAGQEGYQVPNGFRKLMDVMIYSGPSGDPADRETVYAPEMVFDPVVWKTVIQYRLGEASSPYFTYVENQRYLIQPIPSVTGNLIRLRGRLQTSDLTKEDYTAGCIASVANGGTTVTGATVAFGVDVDSVNTFSVDIPVADPFTGNSQTTSAVPFTSDLTAATDLVTLVGSTVAGLGIVNNSAITYTSPTHAGLTQSTVYYVGNISGNTFKVYTNSGPANLVDITVDTAGADWTIDGGPRVTMISPATTTEQGISSASAMIYTGSTGNGLTNGQTYYAGDVTSTMFRLYNDSALTLATTVSGATNPAAFNMVIDPVATLTASTCAALGITEEIGVRYTGTTGGGLTSGTTYYAGNVGSNFFTLYNDAGLVTPTSITSDRTAAAFSVNTGNAATVHAGTIAGVGLYEGAAIVYIGSTASGLTNGTTYYVGNVTTSTFRLYTDSALTTLVTYTADVANGSFTFQSVSWNASMVGEYIQIAATTSANGGDGFWYQIAAVPTSTTLTLSKPYEGTAVTSACLSYTIGEVSVVPEAYEMAILYRSTALYWQGQDDLQRAKMYWVMYDGGNELGQSQEYGGLIGQMLANEGETEEGSYLPPVGSTQNLPNVPYYFPYQDASGFN